MAEDLLTLFSVTNYLKMDSLSAEIQDTIIGQLDWSDAHRLKNNKFVQKEEKLAKLKRKIPEFLEKRQVIVPLILSILASWSKIAWVICLCCARCSWCQLWWQVTTTKSQIHVSREMSRKIRIQIARKLKLFHKITVFVKYITKRKNPCTARDGQSSTKFLWRLLQIGTRNLSSQKLRVSPLL